MVPPMKMESLRDYEWFGFIMLFQSIHDIITPGMKGRRKGARSGAWSVHPLGFCIQWRRGQGVYHCFANILLDKKKMPYSEVIHLIRC